MARSAGVGASIALVAPAARAVCPLDLVPPDASPGWIAAAAAAKKRLELAASADCRAVEVAVRPTGGALVTFTTAEGRMAVRALMAPDELASVLDALLATLPADEPAARMGGPAASGDGLATTAPAQTRIVVADEDRNRNGARAPSAPSPSAPSPIAPASREVHFNLAAEGGVRLGFGGIYATPAVALRPGGTFGPWELSGVAEYGTSYSYLPGGTPSFSLWSFGAALQVGRREKLGFFALGYGMSLGLTSLHEDTTGTDGAAQAVEYALPRVGAYVRLAVPSGGAWRGTFDLGFDSVLGKIKRPETRRSDLPDLPRWGLVTALGVETSLL